MTFVTFVMGRASHFASFAGATSSVGYVFHIGDTGERVKIAGCSVGENGPRSKAGGGKRLSPL
jgi:hypothetical protein